ncbi:hypothetical protein CBL_08371 [Carabus blaptoides fortunei]
MNTTQSEDKSESVTRSATCNCIVESLLKRSFGSRTCDEKDIIVKNKKPVPELNITIDVSIWNKFGFNDLNNLSKVTKRHECSQYHIDSCVKLRQFANQNRTEIQRSDQFNDDMEKYNKTVTANRYIICKLIDVICFLSNHDLTFSGHSETVASNNRGNYIELLYLLSTSDTRLKMHLEESKVFTGLLTRIQNVLIQSVANIILEEIKNEINAAKFVSIIINESTDLCHRSQLATIFRYVTNAGTIVERFVGFTDECKVFFHSLTGFALFFSKSTNRSYAFDEQIKKRFPTVEPTRWNSNSTVLNVVMEYKIELQTFLLNIIENPGQWNSDTMIGARGLYSCLMDFEFNFLLQMFSKIFPSSDNLFDTLLEKCFDISCCSKKVDDFIHDLQSRRNDFYLVWDSLKNEEELGVAQSRKRRKVDNVEAYKRLYLQIIDTLMKNMKDRFADIKKLLFMSLMDVSKFKDYSIKFPETILNALKQCYGTMFNFTKLRSELTYIYSSPDFADKTLISISNYILEYDLTDVFIEVYTFMKLIFTIPVTSASGECSFSTIKRIKTYTGNSLNEERLSSLAIIAIEKQLLMTLKDSRDSTFYDRVIDDFLKKEERIELQYKKY